MLLKTWYMQNSPDKWSQPALEVHVDYDKTDGSISEYKLYVIHNDKTIDVTKLLTNNWPVLVNEILQETDWENLPNENNENN